MRAKPGDRVIAGQPLLTPHTDAVDRLTPAREAVESAITVNVVGCSPTPPVIARISG